MSTKLSPEAARAKYEYNKKYQQRYWEKKAASKRAAAQQQIQTEPVSVSRNGICLLYTSDAADDRIV